MESQDFFLQLVIILLTARLLGEMAARVGIPSVIGELLAGVILGPSLLDVIQPNEVLRLLAGIGVIMLLFEVGLDTDLAKLAKTRAKPFIAAFTGVLAPFILGFVTSYNVFNLSLLTSLFVGSTLTATSIGITVRVLTDLKRAQSHEAQIVLGAAVIDDIIGVVALALLYEFSFGGGINLFNAGKVFLFICVYLLLAPIIARFISTTIKKYEASSSIPGLLPTTIVSLILLFAWCAHEVGAPELLGGFAAGLALSRQFFLPLAIFIHESHDFANRVEQQMKPIIHLFTPIFFVMVGLSLNLKAVNFNSGFIWMLTGLLLVGAILGKLAAGWFLPKENSFTRWAVGMAMIPRGEVGLIFAEVGKSAGIFDNDIYAALILVIALTTLLPPFVMKLFYQKRLKTG
ncbi:MAG: cation:proton antiporter [Chlamydiia bacterium]|nr:cation:proton antiporter [Chlamydiia bacterium]